MKLQRFAFVPVACALLLSAACSTSQKQPDPFQVQRYNRPVSVGGKNLLVEVVADDASRRQGLSDRQTLGEQQGMLFDFTDSETAQPSFWMKNMNFAIDIIWINGTQIVGITKDVPPPKPDTPDAELPSYPAPGPVTHVLEVRAGWSDDNRVGIGDRIQFQ